MLDDTDLRNTYVHVPFIHRVRIIRFIHPSSGLLFCAPQQFHAKFEDLELLFPTTDLPKEIELLFREVEGIDLFNRLVPIVRAFFNCDHDVDVEVTFQSGPDFGAHAIAVRTQESYFKNYLADANIVINRPANREATYWWNNSFLEHHVTFEQVLGLRIANNNNHVLVIDVFGPKDRCKYE